MKRKRLFLAIAALLAAAALWFVRSAWRSDHLTSEKPGMGLAFKTPQNPLNTGRTLTPHEQTNTGQMLNPPRPLAPPDPSRRFRDFTPEQRVEFARKGHGPGG